MSSSNKISEVRMTQKEPEREQRIFTFKATQVVWLLFGILEAMILLRIALKALGANAASPIAAFIYGFTDLFLWPFAGIDGNSGLGRHGAGNFLPDRGGGVCPDRLRPGENHLGDLLPPARAGGGRHADIDHRSAHVR